MDQTAHIAQAFDAQVIQCKKRRVGHGRNCGAKHAKGEIYAFIDADTVASKHWLKEVNRTLKGKAVGVTGPTLGLERDRIGKLYRAFGAIGQWWSTIIRLPNISGYNCAYTKDAFWKAGGFPENLEAAEDTVLSMRIRHQGHVRFNWKMRAWTSNRRARKWGYWHLTLFHLANMLTLLLFKRTFHYPKIR